MKKIKYLLTIIVAILILVTTTSCSSGSGIVGYLDVTSTRTTIVIDVEFDRNELLENKTAKPYINLYLNDTYKEKKDVTLNSNNITGSVTFSSLTADTEYTVKLFVSIDGNVEELTSKSIKTLNSGLSEDDPLKISTVEDLKSMKNSPDAYYVLENDIDLNDESIEQIFSATTKFTGSFDGNGHTIKNFKMASNAYMGLFSYAQRATIKNLNIEAASCNVTRGETYLGVLAGKVEESTIENCKVLNSTVEYAGYTTSNANIAILIGNALKSNISNCMVENSNINISKSRIKVSAGLMIGSLNGICNVKDSIAEGRIEATLYYNDSEGYTNIGGFVGEGANSISNCATKCYIKVLEDGNRTTQAKNYKLNVGGFIGSNTNGTKYNLKNIYALADIDAQAKYTTYASVGGVVGEIVNPSGLKFVSIENALYETIENGIVITVDKNLEADKLAINYATAVGKSSIPTEGDYTYQTAVKDIFVINPKTKIQALNGEAYESFDLAPTNSAQTITNDQLNEDLANLYSKIKK